MDFIADTQWGGFLEAFAQLALLVEAPSHNKASLAYFEVVLSRYFNLQESLGFSPMKPKHHYITHFDRLIRGFGALLTLLQGKICFCQPLL